MAVKTILMGERQLFLISANKSRGDRMQWSDDDYDVGEGSADGPVIDEVTNFLLRRLGTGGSGRSRPWALKAERLKPAKLRWRNLRRSGRSCAGECIRRSGGPSTKDEKEAAPCPSDFHIVASVENLVAACERSKRPPTSTMHIVNGGLSMTYLVADGLRPFLSRTYENFAFRMSLWILAGGVVGSFAAWVVFPPA